MNAHSSLYHRFLYCFVWFYCAWSCASTHAANDQPATLKEALNAFIWTWASPSLTTQVIFQGDGTLLTKEKLKWQWTQKDAQTITVAMDKGRRFDLAFNSNFSSFGNADPLSVVVKGERQQRISPSTAVGSKPAVTTQRTPDPKEMTLAPDWMPHRIHSRKGEINSMEVFCRMLVDKGKEVIPTKIWGPLTWLMPVKEAMKGLPAGSRLQRNHTLENLWFPQDSLHLWTMAIVGFEIDDRCNKFNYVQFICDRDDRVIGVQLIHSKPPFVSWRAPGPDGVSVPYYDFVMDKWNATRSQCVPYQISNADKGVLLIKTALYDAPNLGVPPYTPGPCPGYVLLPFPKYLESIHWYLTAPLANKILEIIEYGRQAQLKGGRLGTGGISGGTGTSGK